MSSDGVTEILSGVLRTGRNTRKRKTSILIVFEIKKDLIVSSFPLILPSPVIQCEQSRPKIKN